MTYCMLDLTALEDHKSVLTLASRGWNGDIGTVNDILIIGTSNKQIKLSGDSRAALFKGN